MVVKRNWRDIAPRVGDESAIIWTLLSHEGQEGVAEDEAPMKGQGTITLHSMQGRRSGDYHLHQDREQVYYFTKGHAKMKIDDVMYDVSEGDIVYVPVGARHQLVNDGEDWVEHLIINALPTAG